jgi:hypothetical protein
MRWWPTTEFWKSRGPLSGVILLFVVAACFVFSLLSLLPLAVEIVICGAVGSVGYLLVLGIFERAMKRRLS